MRTNNLVLLAVMGFVATGCGYEATTGGARGATMKQHAGKVSVVFTNASPDKMCGLQMTFNGEEKLGDNWLPKEGLESGKSIEFKVKPGKYKATWSTCTEGDKPFYAGTLCNEWAFDVKDSTQLFAYVADTVAPTKRAAPKDFYTMVKFPGQKIDLNASAKPAGHIAKSEPAQDDAPAAEHRDPNAKGEPVKQEQGAFDAKDFVEKPKAKKGNKIVKPSLERGVDVGNAKVKFAARN